jgi:A/G-specific adenine glycosylase
MEATSRSTDELRDLRALQRKLLAWGRANRREFPWRESSDPYKVFVAEVLLHRTRADQVVPLYQAAVKQYPTVAALAAADRDAVHRLLHSGGLRWRIDGLLEAVRQIEHRFEGVIPQGRAELETLPGVGHYIATAVRCFAYEQPDAIVDTNTVRVVARLYGQEIKDNLRRNKTFRMLIENLLDDDQAKDFNYALLDLAALVCTPKEPECGECPVVEFCEYGRARLGGHAR